MAENTPIKLVPPFTHETAVKKVRLPRGCIDPL